MESTIFANNRRSIRCFKTLDLIRRLADLIHITVFTLQYAHAPTVNNDFHVRCLCVRKCCPCELILVDAPIIFDSSICDAFKYKMLHTLYSSESFNALDVDGNVSFYRLGLTS
jgi:hypothetical protein